MTRGGLYIDGLVVFENITETAVLARRVTETKYFPELRAIMVHSSARLSNTPIIHAKTGFPVIEVSTDVSQKRGYKTTLVGGRQLSVRTELEGPYAQSMLALTMTHGALPEPLRVAHLLGDMTTPKIHQTR